MRVVPLGDKIVIKRIEPEETTKGGIVLPATAQPRPREGRVLSVGSGRRLAGGGQCELQVKEGDRVLFTEYGGTDVEVDGAELLILSESDVLAVLD